MVIAIATVVQEGLFEQDTGCSAFDQPQYPDEEMQMKLKEPGKFLFAIAIAVMTMFSIPAFAQFGSATRPKVVLPDGVVRDVIFKNCVSCHGIDDYAFHAMGRDEWQTFIHEKHDAQYPLNISRRDERIMLTYLAEHFGPNSIPFPRNYIPREINEFFTDIDARVFLENVCTECHEIRVFDERKSADGWRALVLDMRERGATLEDERVEQLVEWLGRVRGTNLFE